LNCAGKRAWVGPSGGGKVPLNRIEKLASNRRKNCLRYINLFFKPRSFKKESGPVGKIEKKKLPERGGSTQKVVKTSREGRAISSTDRMNEREATKNDLAPNVESSTGTKKLQGKELKKLISEKKKKNKKRNER